MNNDVITNKELFEALTKLQEKNASLIGDVKDAVGKLKETESKLDAAKVLYEKHWSCVIKENFKTSCLTAVIIVAIVLGGIVFLLKDKNGSYDDGKIKAQITTHQEKIEQK